MSSTEAVTITDVASRAGVSIATVSRVINARYGVAETTAERVREAIADLGYESSLSARSLKRAPTGVIGIITSDFEPFVAELLRGVHGAVRGSGYDLVTYSSGAAAGADARGWEQRHLSRLSSLADGTILVTPWVSQVVSSNPVVAVDPQADALDVPSVTAENREGADAAVAHLLGLGHRRIAFIGGRPDLLSARLREDGYRDAHARAGLEVDPSLVVRGDYRPDRAAEAAHTLLDLVDPPTAILAANDAMAISVLAVARTRGVRVPDELSVTGFDDTPEAALADPPLTTVDQGIRELGERAVGLVLDLLDDDRPQPASSPVTLPTRLVVRATSAAPPG
ncbi:LacI family transcriptional regulator [Nitriliruptoraceae bacterium ZYF776]|nr:LacI family transcriptional regulator [Profundirhabdus halotolerans]